MKKKTIDLVSTLIAVVLFIFALTAFWFEKMDGIMVVLVAIISVGLVTFKNDKLEGFIDKLLSIFGKK
jgi:hypothetical protein